MTVRIVADPGANWRLPDEPYDKSWDRCRRLLDAVKAAGAQFCKWQLYTADGLYERGTPEWNLVKPYELPAEWLPRLKQESDERGIGFACTTYRPEDVAIVDPLVEWHKVASFENEHAGLREALAATGKPVIVSTGGIDSARIVALETTWRPLASDVTFLHCVSSYPAKPEQMNLRTIGRWNSFRPPIMGLSDHTIGHTAAVMAVALGASVIEKHVKAFDSGNGPDAHFAAGPATFANYCAKVRLASEMLGDGEKRVMEGEQTQWRWSEKTGLRGAST